MKKTGLIILLLGAAFLTALSLPEKSAAGVQVSINFPALFPSVVVSPPVVVLPGPPRHAGALHTEVYGHLEDKNTLYYAGYWYRPRGLAWYRAISHDGPWTYIEKHRVPRAVVILPFGDHRRWQERRHDYKERHDHRHEQHWRRPAHHDHHEGWDHEKHARRDHRSRFYERLR